MLAKFLYNLVTELKTYYNSVLNKDQNLVKTSNDEPTPIECVEEMVSKIPNEFFENPNLKILDPCCGCGNFFLVILQKLQGHKPFLNKDFLSKKSKKCLKNDPLILIIYYIYLCLIYALSLDCARRY